MLSRSEIEAALTRLGELADQQGITFELVIVGGAAMVLGFDARLSTHDVDGIALDPEQATGVRAAAEQLADEAGYPPDWWNDAAKGYLYGLEVGPEVFVSPGIRVFRASTQQMLAMKLMAWRDDVDIADATTLLRTIPRGSLQSIWDSVEPFLIPAQRLKARYAFEDLWDAERRDRP